MYFYDLNLGPPGAGPSWTLGLSFEHTWLRTTRQCYIPYFKHLSHVVLKKKMFVYIFSMYFYGSNLGPLARGQLDPWDLHLYKLGKGPLGMLHTKFQTSGPSGFVEEDFEYISMHFFGSNLGPPWRGAILDL